MIEFWDWVLGIIMMSWIFNEVKGGKNGKEKRRNNRGSQT